MAVDIWYSSYLHFAVYEHELKGLQNALDNDEHDVNFASDRDGWTALHCACYLGRVEETNLLLSHGGDIFAVDCKGRTALHMICASRAADDSVIQEMMKTVLNHLLSRGLE